MRKILLFGMVCIFTSVLVLADITFEQKVTTSGMMDQPPQTAVHKVWMSKGDFCTEDVSSGMRTIYIADSNILIFVNLNERTYSEIAPEKMKEMTGMAMAMMGQQGGTPDIGIQKTGRTQRIGSWNCYEVVLTQKGGMNLKVEMWITKDIKYDKAQYDKFTEIFSSAMMSGEVLAEWKKLEGFPVKSNTRMSFGQMEITATTEISNVSYAPIPKDIFSVPAGFRKTEFKMPEMPQ